MNVERRKKHPYLAPRGRAEFRSEYAVSNSYCWQKPLFELQSGAGTFERRFSLETCLDTMFRVVL